MVRIHAVLPEDTLTKIDAIAKFKFYIFSFPL